MQVIWTVAARGYIVSKNFIQTFMDEIESVHIIANETIRLIITFSITPEAQLE